MGPTCYTSGRATFGPLVLRDAGRQFELEQEFGVKIGLRTELTCPAGTRTDGASIPRFFWRLIGPPMTGPYRKAAVVHDAGYGGTLVWKEFQLPVGYARKHVDRLFLVLMKWLGVKAWRRWAMYLAVRLFAGGHWKRARQAEMESVL